MKRQLKEIWTFWKNGIENIIVIVGYNSNLLREILFDKAITVLENKNYKWTGAMVSVAIATDYVDEDFILIESNSIVEVRGIS